MRKVVILVAALTGSLLASTQSFGFFDDSHYRGPPVWPVPHAYGYSYARARCGHYYAEPWIVRTHCGARVVRRHHRHKRRVDK